MLCCLFIQTVEERECVSSAVSQWWALNHIITSSYYIRLYINVLLIYTKCQRRSNKIQNEVLCLHMNARDCCKVLVQKLNYARGPALSQQRVTRESGFSWITLIVTGFPVVEEMESMGKNTRDGFCRRGPYSRTARGSAGPGSCGWKQEEMLTLIRFSLSYWKKIKEKQNVKCNSEQHEHRRKQNERRRSGGRSERILNNSRDADDQTFLRPALCLTTVRIDYCSTVTVSVIRPLTLRGPLTESTLLFGLH